MTIFEKGLGKGLTFVGIVVVAVAFFSAPWVQHKILGLTVQAWTGQQASLWGVVIAVVISLALLVLGIRQLLRRVLGVAQVIVGIAGVVYSAVGTSLLSGQEELGKVELQWGFWLVIAAFVLIALGGVLELLVARSADTPATRYY